MPNKDKNIPSYEDTLPVEKQPEMPSYESTLPLEALSPSQKQYSAKEALGRSLLSGATLSLSDEMLGAVGALQETAGDQPTEFKATPGGVVSALGKSIANVVTGKQSLSDIPEKYIKYRDIARQEAKDIEAQHPKLYMAGEMAGGLIAPGLGMGKVLASVPKLAKGAALSERLGNLALKGLAGGTAGTVLGGAYAAGKSEAQSIPELAQDVQSGMKTGAVLGSALPVGAGLIGEGVSATGKLIGKTLSPLKNIPTIEKIAYSHGRGKEGVNLGDLKTSTEQFLQLAHNLGDEGLALKNKLSGLYDDLLNNADSIDMQNVADELNISAKEILRLSRDPRVKEDIGRVMAIVRGFIPREADDITSVFPGRLTPREGKSLESEVGELAFNPKSPVETYKGGTFAREAEKQIGSTLEESIPGLSNLNQKYSALNNALTEIGMENPYQRKLLFKDFLTDENSFKSELLNKIQKFLVGTVRDDITGAIANEKLNRVLNNLEFAGMNIQGLREKILQISKDYSIASELASRGGAGLNPAAPTSVVSSLVGGLSKGAIRTANWLGRQQAKASQSLPGTEEFTTNLIKASSANTSSDISSRAYDLNNDELQNFNANIQSDPALSPYANALINAIETGNEQTKNSLLFSIMQKPEGRKAMQKFLGSAK